MAENSVSRPDGSLKIQVGVDCSEAITGFKALQREIKETVKSVKELESSFASLSIDGINIKGDVLGDVISKTNEATYNFKRSARYLVIDFGKELNHDEIKLNIKGHEFIAYIWQQDNLK